MIQVIQVTQENSYLTRIKFSSTNICSYSYFSYPYLNFWGRVWAVESGWFCQDKMRPSGLTIPLDDLFAQAEALCVRAGSGDRKGRIPGAPSPV